MRENFKITEASQQNECFELEYLSLRVRLCLEIEKKLNSFENSASVR